MHSPSGITNTPFVYGMSDVTETIIDKIHKICSFNCFYTQHAKNPLTISSIDGFCKYLFGVSTPALRKYLATECIKIFENPKIQISDDQNPVFCPNEVHVDFLNFKSFVFSKICNFSIKNIVKASIFIDVFGLDKALNLIGTEVDMYSGFSGNIFDIWATKSILKEIGYQKCLKLFNDEDAYKYEYGIINDTSYMYFQYKNPDKCPPEAVKLGIAPIKIPDRFKDFNDLHDRISENYTKIREIEKNREIDYSKLEKHGHLVEIDGVRYGDYIIKVPKSGSHLVRFGKQLENCMASYLERIEQDRCFLFVLWCKKENKAMYGVEIRKQPGPLLGDIHIVQYSGHKNQGVSTEEKDKLERFLNIDLQRLGLCDRLREERSTG
jgi:hypothetical protein